MRKAAGGAVGAARGQASGARSRAVRAASGPLAQADRARRAAGVGPNFPITALRRPDGGPGPEPPDRPHAGRAAQGARLRAPQREPQDGPERDRVEARLTSKLGRRPAQQETTRPRPRRGDELELTIDRLAHGGAGVARTDGLRRVRARRRAGRPRPRAHRRSPSAPSPRRSSSSCSSRARTGSSREAPHPGAPWQVLPYERQLEEKEAQVARRARAHRRLREPAGRADRARRRAAAATATSSSTRSARTRTASWCSASTARAAGT